MNKQLAKAEQPEIPKFKNEREEAAWWDKHSDFFVARLEKHGKLVAPLKVIKTEPMQAISIRLAVEDIQKAKEIAKRKGKGYQTVLKDAIREGLRMNAVSN